MSPAALEPVFPDLCLRDDMPPRLVQQTKRLVDARGFRGTWGGEGGTQSGRKVWKWLPVIEGRAHRSLLSSSSQRGKGEGEGDPARFAPAAWLMGQRSIILSSVSTKIVPLCHRSRWSACPVARRECREWYRSRVMAAQRVSPCLPPPPPPLPRSPSSLGRPPSR